MNEQPTYIFKNGSVYTVVGGKVVAAVPEGDFDPQPHGDHMDQPMPNPPADVQQDLGLEQPCAQCGSHNCQDGTCLDCGAPCAPAGGADDLAAFDPRGGDTALPPSPAHHGPHVGQVVTTPNGVKGTVLGKVAGMWGDEVTVRFENGVIKRLPVSDSLKFAAAEKQAEPTTFESRLAASVDGDRDSLVARLTTLAAIKRDATNEMGTAGFERDQQLHSFIVQAKSEEQEIKAVLAHLDASEKFEAPAAFEFGKQVVATESLGGKDASWLDHTVEDMIRQAEATDYEKLMDEGPESFVAGLDDGAVANQGVTASMASTFIRSKTAGADEELRTKYEQVWLQRVEQVRRSELANRKQATHKEAAAQEQDFSNLPDDVLFG